MWKYIKWTIISIALALVVGIGGWIGLILYLFSGGCDDTRPTPVANRRGDVAEEELQVCTGVGTVLNYSITLRPRNIKTQTTIVKYSPLSDQNDDTTLRWIDDDTLSIDLGKVRWISPKTDKVGSIHITYAYSKGE